MSRLLGKPRWARLGCQVGWLGHQILILYLSIKWVSLWEAAEVGGNDLRHRLQVLLRAPVAGSQSRTATLTISSLAGDFGTQHEVNYWGKHSPFTTLFLVWEPVDSHWGNCCIPPFQYFNLLIQSAENQLWSSWWNGSPLEMLQRPNFMAEYMTLSLGFFWQAIGLLSLESQQVHK